MADVSNRLMGILLVPKMPADQTCDLCNAPATVRMQGETDSFGAEWCDYCAHHAERIRAGATFTYCVDCDVCFELADPDVDLPRCPTHQRAAPSDGEPRGTCVIHGDYWTDDCQRCGW